MSNARNKALPLNIFAGTKSWIEETVCLSWRVFFHPLLPPKLICFGIFSREYWLWALQLFIIWRRIIKTFDKSVASRRFRDSLEQSQCFGRSIANAFWISNHHQQHHFRWEESWIQRLIFCELILLMNPKHGKA